MSKFCAPYKGKDDQQQSENQLNQPATPVNSSSVLVKKPVLPTTPKSNRRVTDMIKGKKGKNVRNVQNQKKNGCEPSTPKTPTFSMYGIKSPYRRNALNSGVAREGKRYSFVSSQVSTPGMTPGKLIKNFREKIGVTEKHDQNGVQSGSSFKQMEPNLSVTEPITETNEAVDQEREETLQCSPELPIVRKANPKRVRKMNKITKQIKRKDVYQLHLSPQRGRKSHKNTVKENVLLIIEKMHQEFTEFQERRHKLMNGNRTKDSYSPIVQRKESVDGKQCTQVRIEAVLKSVFNNNTQMTDTPAQHAVTLVYDTASQCDSPPFEPMEE